MSQPGVILWHIPGRCDVMILYEATRYMSGLLRAVMLYYMKRPGICQDYSGLWCYDIIWSDQVYVGITQGGDVILYEAARYMQGLLRAVMLWYYKKRPGICRDYSGLWCYDIIWSARYMSGLLRAVMLWYYMKRPGICRDYSGRWCYIIWSGQVYVGITPGCDVMILYEAARYMSGLLRAYVMLWYYMKRPGICRDYSGLWCYDIIWSGQSISLGYTPGGDHMIL